MKKKMLITCTVVLVTAAVILGFVLKNQVRENPDKNTVNVAIGQWDTTQNESQNYWNPDNHAVAKGMGGYYFIQTTDGISKIAFFDETTQEAVAVCAKPECTHSDNTCNAYLCDMKQTGSALYLTDTIYCYNGYLYLIQCEGGMGKLVRQYFRMRHHRGSHHIHYRIRPICDQGIRGKQRRLSIEAYHVREHAKGTR